VPWRIVDQRIWLLLAAKEARITPGPVASRGAALSSVFDLYPISRLANAPAAMLEKFAAPRTSSHLLGVTQRGIHEYRDVVAGTMRALRH
jgi:hypothetical protein